MKINIGLAGYWGWHRGIAYTNKYLYKTLKNDYTVHILKYGRNPISEDFNFDKELNAPVITEVDNNFPDESIFRNWITDNDIKSVIFHEYGQWGPEPFNYPRITRSMGVKAYGLLTMERWQNSQAEDYDRILAPTATFERFMRLNKIRHFTYIPRSIDLAEFPKPTKETSNEVFTFFHPGGWGGALERKNTQVVIEAFNNLANIEGQLSRTDIKLIVTSQKPYKDTLIPNGVELIEKDLSRKEMIDLYYKCDCVVLPSKWETIGIPILESLAAGKPLIVPDIPPLNEFVRQGMNGYTIGATMQKYPQISIYAAEVEPRKLSIAMANMTNKMIYPMLARNSRYIAETLYDLNKNKKYLLEFLKNDLRL